MKRIKIFLLFLLVSYSSMKVSYGQEVYGKNDVWFLLLNSIKINEKFSFGHELHVRKDDWLKDQQQLLIRPFIDYKANNNLKFTLGYTYIKTSPYGKYPLSIAKPEHNFWEQITLSHAINKYKISHRYRIEHRYGGVIESTNNGEFGINGYDFSNRFRYRLTIVRPISERWFVTAFDELWVNLSGDFKLENFDRNWFFLSIGNKIMEQGNVQLAYLHQWIRKTDTQHERHPTLQLIFQYDF